MDVKLIDWLLPIAGLTKPLMNVQNLLLVAIDYLGMSIAAKAAYVDITHVTYNAFWLPETGNIGVVNVTLKTMSDDADSLFGTVWGLQLRCTNALQ